MRDNYNVFDPVSPSDTPKYGNKREFSPIDERVETEVSQPKSARKRLVDISDGSLLDMMGTVITSAKPDTQRHCITEPDEETLEMSDFSKYRRPIFYP